MNDSEPKSTMRTIGLLGATGVGVGAIVGGGILVLAGVAFAATGPGAIVAFAINGVIAVLTALSFAEMSTAFPESGGTYTFAKKVGSVRAAFAVGWILWFAYIVAGVLYARGFAEFAVVMLGDLWPGGAPDWLKSRQTTTALALTAAGVYAVSLARKSTGGGQGATVGKVVVFCVLIAVGAFELTRRSGEQISAALDPFFPHGAGGLLQAMGFTFIALQGFDLIAAIAGEVREPERTIPRSMLLSLGMALVIYLPLLFIVSSVGPTEGDSITAMSARDPETVMATAVKNFMGPTGYWLVMVAAVLSTLSALHANVLAASRVALSMARDRTLPRVLEQTHATRRTPVMAIYASFLALAAILLMLPNLAAAGAAASLIFLISFALAHYTSYLARRRSGETAKTFRTPWFPAVPVIGGVACGAMALFQGFAVPAAGGIAAVWLGLGVILYYALFASRARAVDAFAEAQNPELARLRGRSPLVLVPIANPKSAAAMVGMANAIAPPAVGRVLLLSVMRKPDGILDSDEPPPSLVSAERAVEQALVASLASGHAPEALLTIAKGPWAEIARVARAHRCESLLVGLSNLDAVREGPLEDLLNQVDCDVAVLRAPPGWGLEKARRVMVPIGGRGGQDELRARLLGSLCRAGPKEITFVRIMGSNASPSECEEARRSLRRLAEDETPNKPIVDVVQSDDVVEAVTELADRTDLLILGLQRHQGRTLFGEVALKIARQTPCATIMISRRR